VPNHNGNEMSHCVGYIFLIFTQKYVLFLVSGISNTFSMVICLMIRSVAYLRNVRHGTCHGRHFDGGAKTAWLTFKFFFTVC